MAVSEEDESDTGFRSRSSDTSGTSDNEGLDSDVDDVTTSNATRPDNEDDCLDARRWAANFEPPPHVSTPPRSRLDKKRASRREKALLPKTHSTHRRSDPHPPQHYDGKYRHLLNLDVTAAADQIRQDERDIHLSSTQIGLSRWSTDEKNVFFSALGRLGKSNVRAVARRVGTKSEVEVQQYMMLLQKGFIEQATLAYDSKSRLLGRVDLPAANDISVKCDKALEEAADILANRQETYEQQIEKSQWGDAWLVTMETTKLIRNNITRQQIDSTLIRTSATRSGIVAEHSHPDDIDGSEIVGSTNGGRDITKDSDEDTAENLSKLIPALELFRVEKWLEVAERIFMNSGKDAPDANWQSIILPDEEIGIRATALQDFHTLVIDITKRLVATALFCATSRIRASKRSSANCDVTRHDCIAAIKSLGMEPDSQRFWKTCATRHNLNVYQSLEDDDNDDTPMTMAEVEDALKTSEADNSTTNNSAGNDMRTPELLNSTLVDGVIDEEHCIPVDRVGEVEEFTASPHATESDLSTSILSDVDGDTSSVISTDDSILGEFRSKQIIRRQHSEKEAEKAEDAYLEALDTKTSQVEEKMLWRLLDQSPPMALEPQNVELGRQPKRRFDREIEDWRDKTMVMSFWETSTDPIQATTFADNAKKRKRDEVNDNDNDNDDNRENVVVSKHKRRQLTTRTSEVLEVEEGIMSDHQPTPLSQE